MKPKKYIIDSCSLMQAKEYYPLAGKRTQWLWEEFARQIAEGMIMVSTEVEEEIQDDDVQKWTKPLKSNFVGLTPAIQQTARAILKANPSLLDLNKGKSSADPFIIALAVCLAEEGSEVTVITEEKPIGVKDNTIKKRIPNICNDYKIPVISMAEFIKDLAE